MISPHSSRSSTVSIRDNSGTSTPRSDPETTIAKVSGQEARIHGAVKKAQELSEKNQIGEEHLSTPSCLALICETSKEVNVTTTALDIIQSVKGLKNETTKLTPSSGNDLTLTQEEHYSQKKDGDHQRYTIWSYISETAHWFYSKIPYPSGSGEEVRNKKESETNSWTLVENQDLLNPLIDSLQNQAFSQSIATKYYSLIQTGKKLGLSSSYKPYFYIDDLKKALETEKDYSPIIFIPFEHRIIILNKVSEDSSEVSFYDPKEKGVVTLSSDVFLKHWIENQWQKTSLPQCMELSRKVLVFNVPRIDQNAQFYSSNQKGWMENIIQQFHWKQMHAPSNTSLRTDICTPLLNEEIPYLIDQIETEQDFKGILGQVDFEKKTGYIVTGKNDLFSIKKRAEAEDFFIASPQSKFPHKISYFFNEKLPPPKVLIVPCDTKPTSRSIRLQEVALEAVHAANREKNFLAAWDESGKLHRREVGPFRGELIRIKTADEIKTSLFQSSPSCLIIPFSPSWIVLTGISEENEKVLYLTPDPEWGMYLVEESTPLFLEKLKTARDKIPENTRLWTRKLSYEE